MVNVPSQSSLISELENDSPPTSDHTLQEYAQTKKADNEAKSSSVTKIGDSIQVRRSSGYNRYDEIFGEGSSYDDGEQLYTENEMQEEESSKSVADCLQFIHPVNFVKEMVKQICDDSEEKAKVIWLSLVGASKEKGEVQDEHEYKNVYDEDDEYDQDSDEDNYYGGGYYSGYKKSIEYAGIESRESIISWPTIGEFNVELGAIKIDEYLSSFLSQEKWMYVIYYQGLVEDKCSELHKYHAIYSLPTCKYPIAQATATIFFMIEVSKTLFHHCFVDVKFQYETFRQIFSVGTNELQENWLHYILDSKIKFFQTITY